MTPMSCVISSMAMPRRDFRSSSRARICAWMVTSSAVVGSSATRSLGSQDSAIAIITRCRRPPDRLGHLVADGLGRVQRGERVLEDHGDVVAADLAQLGVTQPDQLRTVEL